MFASLWQAFPACRNFAGLYPLNGKIGENSCITPQTAGMQLLFHYGKTRPEFALQLQGECLTARVKMGERCAASAFQGLRKSYSPQDASGNCQEQARRLY
jgi:hypothetical protein